MPPYLAETLRLTSDVESRRRLRSGSTSTLLVPSTRRAILGDHAFPVAAARAWNTLSSSIRTSSTYLAFHRQLKTAFSCLAFSTLHSVATFSCLTFSRLAFSVSPIGSKKVKGAKMVRTSSITMYGVGRGSRAGCRRKECDFLFVYLFVTLFSYDVCDNGNAIKQ